MHVDELAANTYGVLILGLAGIETRNLWKQIKSDRPTQGRPPSEPSYHPIDQIPSAYLSPSIPFCPPTAAAQCCYPPATQPHPSLAPLPPGRRPPDSPRPWQDLGAGVEDLRSGMAIAIRIKERPPSGAAADVRPPSCRAASHIISALGALPRRPSLPRCTSHGRRPKQQQQRWRPALEDLLHGALEVVLTASLS
jgi:hypothetical protein